MLIVIIGKSLAALKLPCASPTPLPLSKPLATIDLCFLYSVAFSRMSYAQNQTKWSLLRFVS